MNTSGSPMTAIMAGKQNSIARTAPPSPVSEWDGTHEVRSVRQERRPFASGDAGDKRTGRRRCRLFERAVPGVVRSDRKSDEQKVVGRMRIGLDRARGLHKASSAMR